MLMLRRLGLMTAAGLLCASLTLADDPPKNELPKSVVEVLQNATEFELYSLDPELPLEKPTNDFHGWKVLGKASIKDVKAREKLTKAFLKGVDDSTGEAKRGFKPRHGIRVTYKKKTVDIVMSFQYLQSVVYEGDADKDLTIRHTSTPSTVFDDAVKAAGLKTAGK